MQLSNYKIRVDVNNVNDYQKINAIEHQNDAGVRKIEIEYYSNGNPLTFAETATATAAVVTDGVLINETLQCSFNADRTAVIVPIDNSSITTRSGIAKIEVKITEGEQSLTPPYAFNVRVKKSITDDAQITVNSIGTTAQILQEVATARGEYDTLDARIAAKSDKSTTYTKTEVDAKLAQKESLSNKITEMTDSDGDGDYPTSNAVKNYLEGNYYDADDSENVFQAKLYAGENITIGSVQGKAVISADLSGKADKDKVYTKAEVNGLYGLELAVGYNSNDVPVKIAGNSTISAGKFASDEIVKIYVGFTQGIIQNGAFTACPNLTDIYFYNVETAYSIANNAVPDGVTVHFAVAFNNIECITKAVCNFKTAKYDSSNIEEGNATLTAYTGQSADSIKSASCIYQRIGGFVTVNVAVVFNAVTLNANKSIHLINLPYQNASTPVHFTGISSKNAVFKGSVPKSSTWLSMIYATPKNYAFTDGEQLNFTLTYKI